MTFFFSEMLFMVMTFLLLMLYFYTRNLGFCCTGANYSISTIHA